MFDERPIETTLYSLCSDAPSRPIRRRADERQLSLLRVVTLITASRREMCLVRNVSAGGMMIQNYSRLCEGDRVTIELKPDDPLDGVVRWVEDGCFGLHFDKPVDVIRMVSISLEGPRPRMPRIAVDRVAWVREKDGPRLRARITDISQGGTGIELADKLPVDVHVVVSIEGLQLQPAVVRWTEDGAYGLTFNHIIALPELMHWLPLEEGLARAATG